MQPRNSKANSSKSLQRHAKQLQAGSAVHMTASDDAAIHMHPKSGSNLHPMPGRYTLQKQVVSSTDAHLAALKALGKQDTILWTRQPIDSSSNKGMSDQQGGDGHAAVSTSSNKGMSNRMGGGRHAAMHQQQPQKKKAIDMFGVAVDDCIQGNSPGLMIIRPASSLW